MAFLFKRNPKTPADLVRALNDNAEKLDGSRKNQDEVTRSLAGIRNLLAEDSSPDNLAQLAHEVYATDTLLLLVQRLQQIEFDARKNVVLLFTSLLRRKIGERSPTVDYLLQRPQILELLLHGPENTEVSLNTSSMLHEALQYEQIVRMVLASPTVWHYFDYCRNDNFETTMEAFSTLSDLLTVHKKAAADFLTANTDRFIDAINNLIVYPNYVTKRESAKLLAQLLLSKPNYPLLSAYVNQPHNLKLVMILLGDKSKNIQVEAFNIFKVFVANPRKTKAITDILVKNRDKLLEFLPAFNSDRSKYDNLFTTEKQYVIEQIEKLPKIVPAHNDKSPTAATTPTTNTTASATATTPATDKTAQLASTATTPQSLPPAVPYSNPKISAQNVYASTKKALQNHSNGPPTSAPPPQPR